MHSADNELEGAKAIAMSKYLHRVVASFYCPVVPRSYLMPLLSVQGRINNGLISKCSRPAAGVPQTRRDSLRENGSI